MLDFAVKVAERSHAIDDADYEQLKRHGLVGPEQAARCDPKDESIADLPGGAGDRDANGLRHGAVSLRQLVRQDAAAHRRPLPF